MFFFSCFLGKSKVELSLQHGCYKNCSSLHYWKYGEIPIRALGSHSVIDNDFFALEPEVTLPNMCEKELLIA